MRIFLDVTRTLVHSRKRTPTGIDRVEHAYVRYLLRQSDNADIWFIANTPFGRGALSMEAMRRIFDGIEQRQQDTDDTAASPTFMELAAALSAPVTTGRSAPLSIRHQVARDKDSRASVAAAFLRGAARFSSLMREKKPAVYLHTSHLQLDEPHCFDWLKRPELFPIFFIHDLIPIEFPEFSAAGAGPRHALRIETALKHARALIVNSAFTRDSLIAYAGPERVPPLSVVPLANTIREFPPESQPAMTPGTPFFLHVGTIEGRKNIAHLLTVWRHVIATMGPQSAPRLVIVGRRGWEAENVNAVLDRSIELANHVIEVANINDLELHALMRHATGLITVSMTEGYGLPPVEAARLGLPVIASDIPAHREILGDAGEFVGLHDGEALAQKVMALATGAISGKSTEAIAPFSWDEHVEGALSFIETTFGCFGNPERSIPNENRSQRR